MKENSLGVIGGMGPLATDVLYRYIIENTKAEKDQEHIDMVILSVASMPDRTECILKGDISPIIKEFKEDLAILEKAGVKTCLVPCNTCHVILDEIKDITDIRILDMIHLCAASIALPGERIGIMATDGTIRAGLYHKAVTEAGMIPVSLSEDGQNKVMHLIYEQVKKGIPADLDLMAEIEEEFREKGCKKIILGCTELSVINCEYSLSDIYVDPMLILARYAIPFAGGELK